MNTGSDKSLEGGCFCGEVRYKVSGEPVLQLYCFCRDCTIFTGTDGYAGYMVRNSAFAVLKGEPRIFDKKSREGRIVKRHFCGVCGTNLWGQTEYDLVSIAAGTLDDVSAFKPTKKVFTCNAPDWARIPEGLRDV